MIVYLANNKSYKVRKDDPWKLCTGKYPQNNIWKTLTIRRSRLEVDGSLGLIYTVRFLSHATSSRQAYDMTYDCRSFLKRVLKSYDIFSDVHNNRKSCRGHVVSRMGQKSYRVNRLSSFFLHIVGTEDGWRRFIAPPT